MYELVRRLSTRQLVQEQIPLLFVALAIAETFYKFHSFLLESLAFLLTWYVLGGVHAALRQLFSQTRSDGHGR